MSVLMQTLLITMMSLLASCSKEPLSTVQDHDGESYVPVLGEAYDGWQHDLKNGSCVSFDQSKVDATPPRWGDLLYQSNMHADDVQRALSGRVELAIDAGSFNVEGEVGFAQEFRQANHQTNVTLKFLASHGFMRIPLEGVSFNQTALNYFAEGDETAFRKTCGTAFVNQVQLEAAIVGSVIFEFASLSDKLAFDARVKVELASIGDGEAQVAVIMNEIKEHGSVRMRAYQKGGLPERLSHALSTDQADCSATNRAACLRAFSALVSYVSDEYPDQFFDQNGKIRYDRFAKTQVYFRSYDSMFTEELNFDPINEDEMRQLNVIRNSIADRIAAEKGDKAQAQAFLSAGFAERGTLVTKISNLISNIDKRLASYEEAQASCFHPTPSVPICENSVAKVLSQAPIQWPYDMGLLNIEPSTVKDYCEKLIYWHRLYSTEEPQGTVSSTILDQDSIQMILAILNDDEVMALMDGAKQVRIDAPSLTSTDYTTPNTYNDENELAPAISCNDYQRAAQSLSHINMPGKSLNNIDVLASVPYLRHADLSFNKLFSARAIGRMKYLESLNLEQSGIHYLDGVGARTLRQLNLSGNTFDSEELRHLGTAISLDSLDVSENKYIEHLDALPSLRRLKNLNIQKTNISTTTLQRFLERSAEFPQLQTIKVSSKLCEVPAFIEIICE